MHFGFIGALAVCAAAILAWAFRSLPQERWQIMATVPIRKDASGNWVGVNLTYYGVISATAGVAAIAVFLLLVGAVGVRAGAACSIVGAMLAACLPAAKLVARVVEGKQHTLSVAGSVLVGLLVAPAVIAVANLAGGGAGVTPMLPTIAAMAVAYVFGEGLGRLACISFGCCYGKPVSVLGPRARRVFARFHFAFRGETKKISYASGLEGIEVVPVQALTSTVYVLLGLLAMHLFLEGGYRGALILALAGSQLWRLYSETLRADHRGPDTALELPARRLSAYQVMAIGGIFYAILVSFAAPVPTWPVDLNLGIKAISNPLVFLALQAIWVAIFLSTGWSMVTGSVLAFHVHRDRI